MNISIKRAAIKILKISGLSVAAILLLLFLLPVLFPGTVVEKVKAWTNDRLDGEVNFSKVRLTFFSHFPSLTVSMYDVTLKGSAPFKNDTLVAAKEIALGVNIRTLIFNKQIRVDKIFIDDAYIKILANAKGEANYNVYKSNVTDAAVKNDTTGTALRIEKISIENSHLIYDDLSTQILIDARDFNYKGNGDFSKAIFDLNSQLKIDSLDFYYDKEPYLKNKRVNGDLITKINTNSLALVFQQNNLTINKLPVQVNGNFNFLKNGYNLDFTVTSTNSKLDDFVTAMPPQYISWQKNTTIKGTTDLYMTLKGQYIAATTSMPNLVFDMKIRNGYVAYNKALFPASNIFLNLRTRMPSLNTDSLQVSIDSVFFNVDKDYFSAIINTRGITNPFINANINASMDLEKLDNAVGLQNIDLRGKCNLHFTANGLYQSGPNPNSVRHENVLLSIPAFNLSSTISNGYFKYGTLPQAISNISFDIKSSCADSDYHHAGFSINNLSAIALNNFLKGHASVNSIQEMLVDANLKSAINLAQIKNIYPVQGLDVAGLLKFDINAKGKYDPSTKMYPITTADFTLTNGSIKTAYYPNPVGNINMVAKASNAGGNLKSQEFNIQPAFFEFEGKPFELQAILKNFEDINYDVKAAGELDVAKIYKVFSFKEWDVTGFIKADCRFKGKQSDAMSKRYNKLNNEGTLELKDIATTTVYLPKPFIIKHGLFKFKQDKMWFNNFKAVYGQSDLIMNGYLQNIMAYALTKNAVLKGEFNLQSGYFNVVEWTVYAPEQKTNPSIDSVKKIPVAATETGVVVIPANLDLKVTADVKKVAFNGVNLYNAQGKLVVDKGTLVLQNTGFTIIGSETLMDATYASNSINKATFDFRISTTDFDIKRAYDSIQLFRDMATVAGKAKGIISLDYSIKGKLDGNMKPIYPSLEGGGVLSVKKVQVKGLKLFTAVSKKTGKDSIANPDISKVDIKSTVKNNLIKLEKLKIKMAGFRLRMQGETSLDGKLNMKLRLGLPPLGIIGIPMTVKGTQDRPVIKVGKGGTNELKETEYNEEEN